MPKRRQNGAGYVTKLAGQRKKPWYVYAPTTYETDPETGKRKSIRHMLANFKTKKEADLFLANWNLENNPEAINEQKITVADVVALYLSRLEIEKKAPNTIRCNKSMSNHISENLLQKPIKDITYKDLQSNMDELNDRPSTQQNFKILLNHVWHLAVINGYTQNNIVPDLRTVTYEKKKLDKGILSNLDIWRLWEATKNPNEKLQEKAKWTLILTYTGMRASELFTLKCKELDYFNRYAIGGRKTKAGKNRIIPFHDRILDLIGEFVSKRTSDYLINLPDREPKTIQNKVSNLSGWIKKHFQVSSHACRRTFLSKAYGKCDFFLIERCVGHRTQSEGFESYVELKPSVLIDEVNKINFLNDDDVEPSVFELLNWDDAKDNSQSVENEIF